MAWILAILAALAASAAGAAWLRSRRSSPGNAGGGQAASAGSGLESAPGIQGEGAWVSRIAESLPASVRRLADLEAARPESRGGLGLQGNLAQTPLHDLLQYLSLGRKSGVLELASGRRTGRIALAEGRIGGTSYRGKEGMDAAFLMLDLAEGDFEFYEQPPKPAETTPALEVVDLIMLWMARKPKQRRAV